MYNYVYQYKHTYAHTSVHAHTHTQAGSCKVSFIARYIPMSEILKFGRKMSYAM